VRKLIDQLLDPRYKRPNPANSLAWLVVGVVIALFAMLVVLPNVNGFFGAFFGWVLVLLGAMFVVYNLQQIISPPLN